MRIQKDNLRNVYQAFAEKPDLEILPEADIDGLDGLTVSRLVVATMGLIARQQAQRNG